MGAYEDDTKRRIYEDGLRLRMQGPNAYTSTIEGSMEAKRMQAMSSSSSWTAPNPTYNPTTLHTPRGPSGASAPYNWGTSGTVPGGRYSSSPSGASGWFPAVDRWFDGLSRFWTWLFVVSGGFCGFVYGRATAPPDELWWHALGGAVLGLLVLPLVCLTVKLVLTVIVFIALAAAIYLAIKLLPPIVAEVMRVLPT